MSEVFLEPRINFNKSVASVTSSELPLLCFNPSFSTLKWCHSGSRAQINYSFDWLSDKLVLISMVFQLMLQTASYKTYSSAELFDFRLKRVDYFSDFDRKKLTVVENWAGRIHLCSWLGDLFPWSKKNQLFANWFWVEKNIQKQNRKIIVVKYE